MPEKREGDKSKKPEVSRLQKLKNSNGEDYRADLPPLPCGEHLLDHLWTLGPTMCGGMGETPLSHAEIAAYQSNLGFEFTAWEALTLRRLSLEYLNESGRATKRDCPAPWKCAEQEAAIRVAVGRDLEAEMIALMDQ